MHSLFGKPASSSLNSLEDVFRQSFSTETQSDLKGPPPLLSMDTEKPSALQQEIRIGLADGNLRSIVRWRLLGGQRTTVPFQLAYAMLVGQ